MSAIQPLKAKDFASDQEVRWCPGCGDYAIVRAVQRTLAGLGVTREKTVFISGIGCAARIPHYMATYGFNAIHGRAPAIATGVKLANPDLDVWVATGDGDSLSIGGNHLLHALRRNVDMQILMFNNEIYGLTKGQYSPTTRPGKRTPSTPFGSIDNPISAACFALGAGARFIARSVDTLQKHLPAVLKRAHAHKGTSFVEIIQNCIVFNDGAFANFTDRSVAADRQIRVAHGEPLIFGRDGTRGLCFDADRLALKSVTIGENGVTADHILVHDETNRVKANLLAALEPPDFPVALGVLYCDPAPTYETRVLHQVEEVSRHAPAADINALLRHGDTWTVAE